MGERRVGVAWAVAFLVVRDGRGELQLQLVELGRADADGRSASR